MAAQGTFVEDVGSLGNPSSTEPQGSFRYGGSNLTRICVRMGVLTVLTGGGGSVITDFPASIFNLNALTTCSNIVDVAGTVLYTACVDPTQAAVVTKVDGADTWAAIPAGTYRIEVEGYV